MYRYRSTHSESDSEIVHRRGGRRLASFLDDLRSTYTGRRTRALGPGPRRGRAL